MTEEKIAIDSEQTVLILNRYVRVLTGIYLFWHCPVSPAEGMYALALLHTATERILANPLDPTIDELLDQAKA